ncbi:MAG: YciI family protein [Phormidesmis sp.]
MAWFVKIERGIVNKPRFDEFVAAHVDYVNSLIEKGHQARSGYWAELGGGMLTFRAESMAAAKAIVEADPLVLNHCVDYELHEWCVVAEPAQTPADPVKED